ncbi:MAG: GGDEF domain-containing protein [Chloroflexota bacterium]
MSNDELVLILSVGLLSLAALGIGLVAAWLSSHRRTEPGATPGAGRLGLPRQPDEPAPEGDGDLVAPRRAIRDRIVRVVALSYLVAVAVVAAVSGGWGTDEATIYLLVALGTLAVVTLGDLVADRVPALVRGWAEGTIAIVLVTAITGLTGGILSPFAAGYFLIVGAAALSRDPLAPLAMALVSALAAAAVDLAVWPRTGELWPAVVAAVAFLGVTLLLVATIVAVAVREHLRAQDATLRLARFDPLTGLYNRTHFFTELEREIRLAQRAGRTFALLMIDVDGLKPVNDQFGHHYGDRLLTGVTGVIRNTVRATDTPARYGGDEFLVLLPETDAAGAYVVAEKLRHDIAGFTIQVSDRTVRTSVSLGLVTYPEDGTTADDLMTAADAALYEAKRSGRDRIVGYTTRMERVTTRMGGAERRIATPLNVEAPAAGSGDGPTTDGHGTPPAGPGVGGPASSGGGGSAGAPIGGPSSVVSAGQAPWVTGTNADWETRGRARVAVPMELGGRVAGPQPGTPRVDPGPAPGGTRRT